MEKVNYKYEQFKKALLRLEEAESLDFPTPETKIDSVIQRFEFTVELFWKFLKEMLDDKGIVVNAAPVEVVRAAKSAGYIDADDMYITMIKDRNLTSHTYDEAQAKRIYEAVVSNYLGLLKVFVEQYEARN